MTCTIAVKEESVFVRLKDYPCTVYNRKKYNYNSELHLPVLLQTHTHTHAVYTRRYKNYKSLSYENYKVFKNAENMNPCLKVNIEFWGRIQYSYTYYFVFIQKHKSQLLFFIMYMVLAFYNAFRHTRARTHLYRVICTH